jgi:FAD/FMN-containing dehydrogenase
LAESGSRTASRWPGARRWIPAGSSYVDLPAAAGLAATQPGHGWTVAVPSRGPLDRGNRFLLEYTATSDPVQSVASPGTASDWLGQVRELLHEHGTGRAYQNFANPELADPLYAYYGEHLPRLRNVKARYDPDDFFHHEQSIPPIHEE